MANWLAPAVIATLVGTILLTVTSIYLYTRHRDKFMALWALGWGIYALRFVIEIIQIGFGRTVAWQALIEIINLTHGVILLWGAREMAGRRLPKIWWILAGLGYAWVVATALTNQSFFVRTAPSFTLAGVVFVWTGITFLRNQVYAKHSRRTIGWSFILWGVHKWNFPILREVAWFAPIGFLIGGALEMIIAFAFFILYFEKLLEERRQVEADLRQAMVQRERQEAALLTSEQRFRAVFEQAGVGVNITDHNTGRYIRVNRKLCEYLGYAEEELLNMAFKQVTHPDDLPLNMGMREKLTTGELDEFTFEKRYLHKKGHVVWGLVTVTALWHTGEEPSLHLAVIQDITARKQAEMEVQTRARQQAAVARLGQMALTDANSSEVMQRAVEEISQILDVTFARVLELMPDHESLLLKAEVGWKGGLIGQATMPNSPDTLAGYTLIANQPVIVRDISEETRFHPSDTFMEHGIVSGVSVLINGETPAYGVLCAHATQRRAYTEEDVSFMKSIANILSTAVRRERYDAMLKRQVQELEALNRISSTLRSVDGLDALLPILLDEILVFYQAGDGSIVLFDDDLEQAEKVVGRGWLLRPFPATVNPQQGILKAVKDSGRYLVVEDFAGQSFIRDEVRAMIPQGWGGAAVPIQTSQGILGLILLSVQHPRQLKAGEVRLLETIAEMTGVSIQRTRLLEQTRRSLDQMQALHEIDMAISSSLDLGMTLSTILNYGVAHLGVDAADLLQLNEYSQNLDFLSGKGFKTRGLEYRPLRLGEGVAGCAALERKFYAASAPDFDGEPKARVEVYRQEGFEMLCAVPVISKGQVLCVMEVFSRKKVRTNREWVGYLETLAGQAAIAIENLGLFERMQRTNTELILAYNETIEGWSRALDLRDHETQGHTRRVTDMAVRLARALHVSEDEVVHIRRGALLHDIGKMGVPDEVLNKPGPLTDAEWKMMREHPLLAYEMLSPVHYLRPALDIPYSHHERWDGSGYPRGLCSEEIPLAARIFAVVDVWDALRSTRPYREAWPEELVRAYLREKAGIEFDPQVVEAFMKLLERLPPEYNELV